MNAHTPATRRRRRIAGAALVAVATLTGLLIAVAGLSRVGDGVRSSRERDSNFLELMALIRPP
jgi:hypothetical protein